MSNILNDQISATAAGAVAATAFSPRCACGHAAEDHDAIASRYCDATLTSELSRGCICRPLTVQQSR